MKNSLKHMRTVAAMTSLLLFLTPVATGAESISHIHQIDLYKDEVLLGTHEGVMKLGPGGSFSRVGNDPFDVMGMAILDGVIYASGHPFAGDSRPPLLGLLDSKDGGKTWRQVSLKGEVDFHLLEVSPHAIIGGDSAGGKLFFSTNKGVKWSIRGKNIFEDIALSPESSEVAFGISNGKLMKSIDGLKTWKLQKPLGSFSQIAWIAETIFLSSGKQLLQSNNGGKSWKSAYKFKANIGVVKANSTLVIVTVGNKVYQSINGGKEFALRK